MKYPRTLLTLTCAALAAAAVVGSGAAAPLELPSVVHNPLQSTIANPTQLSVCVDHAAAYTNATYPVTHGKLAVVYAKQVYHRADKDELLSLAPRFAALTPYFDVLMSVVYVEGSFRVKQRSGSVTEAKGIVYLMTPYPSCLVTARMVGELPALRR